MNQIITIYFILNCLFLAYVRLRDTGNLKRTVWFLVPVFIFYIGFLALPLQLVYMFLARFKPKPIRTPDEIIDAEIEKIK